MPRSNERADIERISQVLAGLDWPAAKWQLISYGEEYGADAGTRAQLWALPPGTYPSLRGVLVAMGLVGTMRSLRRPAVLARRPVPAPADAPSLRRPVPATPRR
ncbi:MAG: DUF2795 domain-containing protein [Pseudonocardia sp.]